MYNSFPYPASHTQRRNAVDFGAGENPQYSYPVSVGRYPNPYYVEDAVVERTAVPFPVKGAAAIAPIQGHLHPYELLGLNRSGSRNHRPHPSPSDCAECRADSYIAIARERYPNAVAVVPDGPLRSKISHDGLAIKFTPPRYSGCRPQEGGVLVDDILNSRDCMLHPALKLLNQRYPGALNVTLHIENLCTVEDILLASCKHRMITNFNLAWWLAFHFRVLVQHELRRTIDGLELVRLYSPDGKKWLALARYRAH
ncbi:hypothetical protein FB451DRAFT_1395975 [Mycena latifolia]|nr:hypothetical protein FB451DRAFT_1395975 [Mycena latifolia]